jgi:septum formation protein
MKKSEIILASGSQTRLKILHNTGVSVRAAASNIDEGRIKKQFKKARKKLEQTALALALAKAKKIAARHKDALVIGADQMLECGNTWLDKARNKNEALHQLEFLSGKTHRLVTATVLMRGEKMLWQDVAVVKLTMRKLSKKFIAAYVKKLGPAVLQGVGCYQIEGLGVQLFTRIEGDYFVILGLNLLPLLAALRAAAGARD